MIVTFFHPSGSNGGGLVAYGESEAPLSTGSVTFINKLTLGPVVLAAGDYLVQWCSYGIRSVTRCQVDGVDIGTMTNAVAPVTSAFRRVSLAAGPHTFTVDFRLGSGASCNLEQTRIAVSRA